MSLTSFSELALKPALLSNLDSLGYQQMTPIQGLSLPPILKGKDVIAQGKTGSGKTAAFGLGLLQNLDAKRYRIQSLVLCPTRELADQVAKQLRALARAIPNVKVLTLCGGVPFGPQRASLEHGAHIIVGTPGRIEDHLGKGTLDLRQVNTLVLDEADRMLEMGFQDALDTIFSHCSPRRQNLLFSATFPAEITKIAKKIMFEPETVKAPSTHDSSSIQQVFYQLRDKAERPQALQRVLLTHDAESAVVFCTTKVETQQLADDLQALGFSCLALHGDLEQRQRDQTLARFANKSIQILVATDVAARGLDIDQIELVVNYHVSRDPEVHVHRIGRTGRAGANGLAVSLVAEHEANKIIAIEDYLDIQIETQPLPSEASLHATPRQTQWVCLQIDAGKKQKLRPGDILGALTRNQQLAGSDVGKIQVMDYMAYVAVKRSKAKIAFNAITTQKMKGRSFKARRLRG
ncbi:ATP-dependent RNA helicase DbpA [Paraferrimonas sedimenticola]|uniref:ATP-dependent RNA helicase DbpA n=1 Tax=Paraferrimonas sedimenticola TaxID=375674 RepID=UPI000BA9C592|nr:ATP-dependent RNA helicase DbpA [Paraferrimonas sedimenticola]